MPTPRPKWRDADQGSRFQVLQLDVKIKYVFGGNDFFFLGQRQASP